MGRFVSGHVRFRSQRVWVVGVSGRVRMKLVIEFCILMLSSG